jgi:hypothetical protein
MSMQEPTGMTFPIRPAALAIALLAGVSQAGPLADPTSPPAAISQPRNAANAVPLRTTPRPALATAALPVLPAPLLQSLYLPANGPAVAMIDGQLVRAGDPLGTRRVLSIDGQGLMLTDHGGSQRLWLLVGQARQAAGSITTSRRAAYLPAAAVSDSAPPSDRVANAQQDRPGGDGGDLAEAQPAGPDRLSLSGERQP